MTKIAALFGVPSAIVSALLLVGVVDDTVAGALGLVLYAVQTAVAGYFDPRVPWFGSKPDDG